MQQKKYLLTQRILNILLSVFLLVFGLTVFVPWSVYFGNSAQFSFIFGDFYAANVFLTAVLTIIISGILMAIPPKTSRYLVSGVWALGLCVYLQSMFMNCFLGEMNGTEPQWQEHWVWGVVNIVIWFMIVLIPVAANKLAFKFQVAAESYIASAVILLELVAVVSMLFSASENAWQRKYTFFCDGSKQFQFSSEKNILVILFDQFGSAIVEPAFKADPQFRTDLKDFTWYTDARGQYSSTFPAVLHEITGSSILPANNLSDLFHNTWNAQSPQSFYQQMSDLGYDSRIYAEVEYQIGNLEHYQKYFSNIKTQELTFSVDKAKLYNCLVKISGFSAMPYLLKRHFFYADDFTHGVIEKKLKNFKYVSIPNRNDTYYTKFSGGISVDASQPVFTIHYTRGIHAPRCVDERCRYHTPAFDDILPGARSCLFLLSQIVKELKEKNIYDQTAIIVFSDHSTRSKYDQKQNGISLMIKPFGANNKEMLKNNAKVSSIDIIPTILHMAAGDKGDFKKFEGYPVSSIPPDRVRKIYVVATHPMIEGFVDMNNNVMQYNCFASYVLDTEKNFSWKHAFIKYIPWNKNAEVAEEILKDYKYAPWDTVGLHPKK